MNIVNELILTGYLPANMLGHGKKFVKVVWRKGGPLVNEVDTTGTLNGADYTAWRALFGNPSGVGAGAIANTVAHEPATSTMLIMVAAGWFLRRAQYT
jgi:hypothetical protein